MQQRQRRVTGNYRLTRRRRSSSVRKTVPVNKNAEWIEWMDFEGWRPVSNSSTSYRERDSGGPAVLRWFQPPFFFFLCGLQSLQLFSLQDIMLPKYHFWGFKAWWRITHKDSKVSSNILLKTLLIIWVQVRLWDLLNAINGPHFFLLSLFCLLFGAAHACLHPPPPSSSSILLLLLLFLLQQQLQKLWVSTTVHLFIFLATFLSEFASYWYCTVLYCLYYICTLLYFVPTAAKTISVFKKISCPVSWANKRSPWLNL